MKRSLLTVIACLGLGALASCSDQLSEQQGPRNTGDQLLFGQAPQLLRCTPLAADSVSAPVGPAGATIAVGPHLLTIPEGALTSSVTITAVAPSDTVRRVEFAPDGLQFAQAAELRLSYAGCDLLGSLLPRRIVQVSATLDIIAALPSLDLGSLLTTSAALPHFSGYAVAW